MVIFLIELLYELSSAISSFKCNARPLLAKMTLPSRKSLWNAPSRSEWEEEYIARPDGLSMNTGKHLTYGDLLEARFGTDGSLDSWLVELDEFGTLIMAAASLPGF
jgi:hypothetical protein